MIIVYTDTRLTASFP